MHSAFLSPIGAKTFTMHTSSYHNQFLNKHIGDTETKVIFKYYNTKISFLSHGQYDLELLSLCMTFKRILTKQRDP